MKSASKRKPPLEGGGALRAAILQVSRTVEANGRRTGEILIRVSTPAGEEWGSLSEDDLLHNKITAIAAFAIAHDIDTGDMDETDLRTLCRQLRAAAKTRVLRLRSTGYFQITASQTVAEGFVVGGKIWWANDQPHPDEVVYVDDRVAEVPSCSVREWKDNVGALFKGQCYMIVALGASLAALLVRPLDLPKLSLYLIGPSSTGKSALQRACLSICRTGGDLKPASGTAKGIHMLMGDYPDEPFFLDDAHKLDDPAGLLRLGFNVGNSASRVVGSAAQTAVVGKSVHCLLIASAERTIAESALSRAVQIDAGYGARVFELIVGAKHGVFNALDDGAEPAAFAKALATQSKRYYGAVWPAWVEAVARDLAKLKAKQRSWMPQIRQRLESAVEGDDPVVGRMIDGYAGWLFALVLAIKYELIPLSKSEVIDAFCSVLTEQEQLRGAGKTQQQHEILSAVRFALDRNRQSFVPWEDRNRPVNAMWGYTRNLGGKNFYLLLPPMLEKISRNYSRRDVVRALEAAGLLETNRGLKTYAARLSPADDPKRFYAISTRIHGDG